MNIELVELDRNTIGKKLGTNLFNSKGSMLLGEGAEINSFHFTHLKEIGYQSIYIKKNTSSGLGNVEHVISERLLAQSPLILKNIFAKFMSPNKIDIFDAKKELNSFADKLLANVETESESKIALLDLKRPDDYIYQHSVNVALYSILIGQNLFYRQSKMFDLTLAALLHDIGMLEIEKSILNKPSELTENEYNEVKKHTLLGFQRLGRHCSYGGLVTIAAVQHHERCDGSGYPNKLSGDQIHEYSQIIALADFFDAYTSDRPYRRLHSIDDALEYIKNNKGKLFAAKIVENFLSYFE